MKKLFTIFSLLVLTGLSNIIYAQIPSYVPTNGLVGWWPFNGNANDESGNGNNGTVNGATLTTDRLGNANSAYSFDGSNDNINPLQNYLPPMGTSNRTVSIWFQRIGAGGCLFSYGSATTSNAYMIAIGSNIISNQGWADDFPVYPTIDNNWHHLVCTFDGLNVTIYLDNTNLGSGPKPNWNTIAGSFYFGTRVLNDMDFFNGNIDDIAIWSRVLTPCEIYQLYTGSVLAAPTATTSYTYCQNETATQLTATGTSLLWYNVPSGGTGSGTAPTPSTTTPGTTHYYVSQTVSNCEGSRTDITVTVNANTSDTILVTTCDSYTAPDATIYTTSGIKTAIIPNALGCDSTITINLTIKNSSSSSISPVVCNSYTAPDAQVYTNSGNYTAIIPNFVGCDSTITIDLTVNHASTSTISPIACFSYTAPDGAIYTSSGTQTAVIPNVAGCDSTITINLTVNHVDNTVTVTDPTITSNATIANYQWVFCPSLMAISGATNQAFTAVANGYYACIVSQNGCVDTTDCYPIMTVGLGENSKVEYVSISPNPTTGIITLKWESSRFEKIEIYDFSGKLTLQKAVLGNEVKVDLSSFPVGIYNVVLVGEKTLSYGVIKK